MNRAISKITVLGDGAWGTSLALVLLWNGHDVTLWGPFPENIRAIHATGANKFLKGVTLPKELHAEADIAKAVADAGLLVLASPSQYMRGTLEALKPHFRNMIKQRGGMFAKGFLFGVQFDAYFKDGLWLDMARHAVTQAQRIAKAAQEKGYTLYAQSPTNQVFVVLSHEKIAELEKNFAFEAFGHVDDDHEAMRFVCSWATKPEAVDALIESL